MESSANSAGEAASENKHSHEVPQMDTGYFDMDDDDNLYQFKISSESNMNEAENNTTQHYGSLLSDPTVEESASSSADPSSGSVFIKQTEATGLPPKHIKNTPSLLENRKPLSNAQQSYQDAPQFNNASLDSIFRALFEFSCEYKELEKSMVKGGDCDVQLESTEMSFETLMKLYQKTRDDKRQLQDIASKLLLDCNVDTLRAKGTHDFGAISGGIVDGIQTNFWKCECGRNVVVKHEISKSNISVKPDVHQESVQSKNIPNTDSAENSTELQNASKSDFREKMSKLSYDVEVLQNKCRKLEDERRGLQEKVFEVESELCSAEVERDLKSEEARYLEEQVCSVRAMLSMRDNELSSLRKRYKFLNEAFQNSEELRETLEKDTCRQSGMIGELEERLEMMRQQKEERHGAKALTDFMVSDGLDQICTLSEHASLEKDNERLEREAFVANEALDKERLHKESVEDMMANVENERRLLLNELDTSKDLVERQHVEINELREQVHAMTKQNQSKQHERPKEQLQELEAHEMQIRVQSKQILELQSTISRNSRQMQLLQEENKQLEAEVYQQLELIEKVENENTSLREMKETTLGELRKYSFTKVEELVASYCLLLGDRKPQEQEEKEYENLVFSTEETKEIAVSQNETIGTNCSCKLYSVPKSEYVKVMFQLKNAREELRNLKEVTVPGAMQKISVKTQALKEQKTTLKNENKEVKKWLKTMKDRIKAVSVEDEVAATRSVMLQTQLHETRLKLMEEQHELDVLRKEKVTLVAENKKQKDALDVMKERLVELKETHTRNLEEMKENIVKLEKLLQHETTTCVEAKAKIALLEISNSEVTGELERTNHKLKTLQKEHELISKHYNDLKINLIEYFGNESLKSVNDLLNSKKKECDEYLKIIENNKQALTKSQNELISLTEVNTVLRNELSENKMLLENEILLKSQNVVEVNCQKRQIERLQSDMQILQHQLEKKEGDFQECAKRKDELHTLETKMDAIISELEQTKLLLSEKEASSKAHLVVIQELQATCKVYEEEFAKMSPRNAQGDLILPFWNKMLPNAELKSSNMVSDDDKISGSESDSSVENLQELQEMFRRHFSARTPTEPEKSNFLSDEKEPSGKNFDFVALETQLHEAKFALNEKHHELEMVKKENAILLSESKKQEESLAVIKDKLIQDQKIQKQTLEDVKGRQKILERELQREIDERIRLKAKSTRLEEHNNLLSDEFENLKHKLESLQYEKQTTDTNFTEMKLDVIKYFGNESLQSVSNSWNLAKQKCAEYDKIIENNKTVILAIQQEIVELKYVNRNLKNELDEARSRLENEVHLCSQKGNEISSCKNEISGLREKISALEIELEEERAASKLYETEKKELNKLRKLAESASAELSQTKMMLSTKEKEQESLKTIIQELKSVCQVYEQEFQNSTSGKPPSSPRTMLLELNLEAMAESKDEKSPENEQDSTAKKLRDLQEVLQSSLSAKVQVFQKKIEELMEELCSCRKQNEHLQQRLHSVEMRCLETEAEMVVRRRDEELDKVLDELAESQKLNESIVKFEKGITEKQNEYATQSGNWSAILSSYKEIVRRLRIENATYEKQLAKANEEIETQKQLVAELNYSVREKCGMSFSKVSTYDVEIIEEIVEPETSKETSAYQDSVFLEDAGKSTNLHDSESDVTIPISALAATIATKGDARQQLESLTAKYINLKAAFEGCRRRLRFLEGSESEEIDQITQERVSDCRSLPCRLDLRTSENNEFFILPSNNTKKGNQKDQISQTDLEIGSGLYFTEMSVAYSEDLDNVHDGKERMSMEVTLEIGNDLFGDSRNGARNEVAKLQNCSVLKNEIEKLEKCIVTCREEINRIKVSSFNQKLNFEKKLESNYEVNDLLSKELKEIKQEKDEQENRLIELEENLLSCNEEIKRIKICSLKERETYGNIIKNFRSENQAMSQDMDKLRNENNYLNSEAELLGKKFQECFDELHRIKTCSFSERSVLENTLHELTKACKNYENQEHLMKAKLAELQEQLFLREDETRRIKTSAHEDIVKLQTVAEELRSRILKHEQNNANLKKENWDLDVKNKELEQEILLSTEKMRMGENVLLSENRKLETNIKMLQSNLTTMENSVQEQSKKNDLAKLKIKNLEDNMVSFIDEAERSKFAFSSEKKSFELTIVELQEKLECSKAELHQEKVVKNQLETKINELEENVFLCEKETQRLKLSFFEEREELGAKMKEEYKELLGEKRLRDEEIISLKSNLLQLVEQKENGEQLLNEINEQQEKWKQKCQELNNDVGELKSSLTRLAQEKEESEQLLKEVTEEHWKSDENMKQMRENHQREIKGKEEEIMVLRNTMDQLRNDNNTLQSSMKELDEERTSEKKNIEEIIRRHEIEATSWKEKCCVYESDTELLQTTIEHLRSENNVMNGQVIDLNKEKDEQKEKFDQIIQTLQDEISSLKFEQQSLEEERELTAQNSRNVEKDKTDAETMLIEVNHQNQKLKDEILEIKSKYESKVEQLEQEISAGLDKIARLNEKLNVIQREKEEREHSIENMEAELKSKDKCCKEMAESHNKNIDNLLNKVDHYEKELSKNADEIVSLTNVIAEFKKEKESADFMVDEISKDKENLEMRLWESIERSKEEGNKAEEKLSSLSRLVEELEFGKSNAENNVEKLHALSEDLHVKNVSLEDNLSLLKEQNSDLQKNLEELIERNESMTIDMEKLNIEFRATSTELSNTENSLKVLQENQLAIKGQCKTLEEEAENLRNTIHELETRNEVIVQLNKEKESAELLIYEITREKENLEMRLQEITEKLSKTEKQVSSLTTLIENLEHENSKAETNVENLNSMSEDLRINNILLEQNLSLVKEQNLDLRRNVEELKEENHNIKTDMDKISMEYESKSTDLQDTENSLKVSQENELALKNQCNNLTKEAEILRNTIDDLEKKNEVILELKKEKESAELLIHELTRNKETLEMQLQEITEISQKDNELQKDKASKTEEQVSSLTRLVRELEYGKSNAETNVEKLNALTEDLRAKIISLEEDLSLAKEQNFDLRKNVEKLEQENESIQIDMGNLNIEFRSTSSDLRNTQDNLKVSQENELELRNQCKILKEEAENLRSTINDMEKMNEVIKQEKESAEFLLGEISKDKENLEIRFQEITEKASKTEEQLCSLTRLVEELENEKTKAETNVEKLSLLSEDLRMKNVTLEEDLSVTKEQNLDLQKKVDELKEENKTIKIRIEKINIEIELRSTKLRETQNNLKVSEGQEAALRQQCKGVEEEAEYLRNKIIELEEKIETDINENNSLANSIENNRERLKVIRNDIEEETQHKLKIEDELRVLRETIGRESSSWTKEKEKHDRNVLTFQEIINELIKGKQTLLAEIAKLSDKKKDMERVNDELSKITKTQKQLLNENEQLKEDNTTLELQMSSLKVTLDTLQKAYEEAVNEKQQSERRLEEMRNLDKSNQMKQKFEVENTRLTKQVTVLENRLRNSTTEKRELYSSLDARENQLMTLEKEYEKCKNENVDLLERLKKQAEDSEHLQKSESLSSSTQASNLRQKLKDLRAKLSEEKKQREIFEFEIRNLKEKVERLSKNEKVHESQLETNRKKLLEMKTERDGLALDLDSVNKRKKRDIEGYTNTIESLQHELKTLRERKVTTVNIEHTKEAFDAVKEEKRMLEKQLAANTDRYSIQNNELKTSLEQLQERYDTEISRFKSEQSSMQDELLQLKQSLSSLQRETESKTRELVKVQNDLSSLTNEKQQVQLVLEEKSSELKKWKKEAFDSKAEIEFLRGALNILEKEGLGKNPEILET